MSRSRAMLAILGALAATAAVTCPEADAAVACNYDSGADVLQVTMGANGDAPQLGVDMTDRIIVRTGGSNVACTGGLSSLSNTGNVTVTDNSGTGNTTLSVPVPTDFDPSTKIIDAPGSGTNDQLDLGGSVGGDTYEIGATGIGTDATVNNSADITWFGSSPETITADGGPGGDSISGAGATGVGGEVPATVTLDLFGENGGDRLNGGLGPDYLNGGPDGDVLNGLGGNDTLIPDMNGSTSDTVGGQEGEDLVSYAYSDSAVTVDLSRPLGAQESGGGTDTLSGIEDVDGGPGDDILIGDDGVNKITGGTGLDRIDGRAGDDTLTGGANADTVSYSEAAAPVTVNLTSGKASGGAGADTVAEFESVDGSRFADQITGNDGPNQITGEEGRDFIRTEGGDDTIQIRDGEADDAGCGGGSDHVVADRLTLDAVQADCELVDALPEQPPNGGGDTDIDFRLRAAAHQLLSAGGIAVRARCPAEACSVLASASGPGKLRSKKAHKAVTAGDTVKLVVRLTRAQRSAARAKLAAGKTPKLRVSAVATDAAGNTLKRTVPVALR